MNKQLRKAYDRTLTLIERLHENRNSTRETLDRAYKMADELRSAIIASELRIALAASHPTP